jgi:hypothetical protein
VHSVIATTKEQLEANDVQSPVTLTPDFAYKVKENTGDKVATNETGRRKHTKEKQTEYVRNHYISFFVLYARHALMFHVVFLVLFGMGEPATTHK